MEKEKHVFIRIDLELLEKFRSVAEYYGRSLNGQILYFIRQAVRNFEEANTTHEKNNPFYH